MGDPTIPTEAVAHHIAILGKTGSGKSNAAKTVVETLLDAGERVCVLDPTGTWYGLRLTRAGKRSPYPVVIFGGNHADLAIGGQHGSAIAAMVGTSSTPAIIDTRLLSVGDRTRFATDFAETLLRRNAGQLTLVIDEAHVFAPKGKVNDPKSGMMLGAFNNLVSLGRGIGLRIILISQRPAKLHNDCLGQVETLVAMRMILPHDREAVMDWMREQADPGQGREIVASLPSLPTGDAWVWSPQLGLLERRHFPLARTFDSGKAPAAGEEGPTLTPLDMKAVTARLEEVAADVVANDPKALKAEITRLKAEAAKAPAVTAPDPATMARVEQSAERAGYDRGYQAGHAEGVSAGRHQVIVEFEKVRTELPRLVDQHLHDFTSSALKGQPAGAAVVIPPRAEPPKRQPAPEKSTAAPIVNKAAPPVGDGSVPTGCAKPLAALAAVYPSGLTEPQWALAAGYKRTGGTWAAYKSRLRSAGLIEPSDGRWRATEAGAAAVGPVEMPPSPGPDLVRWWAAKLPGTSKVAEALIDAWPENLDRDDLAERIGMTASGGSYAAYLSRLAGPGLIERAGRSIRLSDAVMSP